MKKLKLNLDDLKIDSFEINTVNDHGRGTVKGDGSGLPTCDGPETCGGDTCQFSCDGDSCDITCISPTECCATFTCPSKHYTCDDTCAAYCTVDHCETGNPCP